MDLRRWSELDLSAAAVRLAGIIGDRARSRGGDADALRLIRER